MRIGRRFGAGFAAISAIWLSSASAAESRAQGPPALRFERVVIDGNFPGGYQVEVADVNGDGKPDLVAVGGGTCAWYENPSWAKRAISTPKETPDIISSATADLDGDGKAEVAIACDFAMNTPTRGKLLLAVQGTNAGDPWTFAPVITDAAGRPDPGVSSIHRLRWAPNLACRPPASGKRPALVVAPIFGRSATPPAFEQEPATLFALEVGARPKSGRWARVELGQAPVLHAIEVVDLGDGSSSILGASNRGVSAFVPDPIAIGEGALTYGRQDLAPGAPGEAPKRGASEVHLGKFKDGRRFLATVEPWHGADVAVYLAEAAGPLEFGPRAVIDSTLKEGHALWVADVDGDGDDEVFAGYRGDGGGVLVYDFDGKGWARAVLDRAIAAQDLRGGDLDGDGTPDVVAIGGRTHNIVWYRPIRAK